jgi:hypothetical protein
MVDLDNGRALPESWPRPPIFNQLTEINMFDVDDDYEPNIDVCTGCGRYYDFQAMSTHRALVNGGWLAESGEVLRRPIPQQCFKCLEV